MRPLIVEVPSPLGLRPSGVERAPAALRTAGLHARLGCDDAQHVAVPAYDDRRDTATGVLKPGGIAEVAFSLAGVIESALQASRLPVVLGGDYRHPGGLSWDEAAQLLQGLLGRPGARGLNVTIFNPNLDPDGSIARQLAGLIARCVPAA
jgi:arginase family enzyme